MANIPAKPLFAKLNRTCQRAMQNALGLCVSRNHPALELEHLVLELLQPADCDARLLLEHYQIDVPVVRRELDAVLQTIKPTNSGRSPSISADVIDLVRNAWVFGSLIDNAASIRGAYLLVTLLTDRNLKLRASAASLELSRLSGDALEQNLKDVLPKLGSIEESETPQAGIAGAAGAPGATPAGPASTAALDQFTMSLTDRARKGQIDPVLGRDAEIRQVIDILTRRRQNNPILTGEAGVGKTAVVEGLALRIVAGDVPDPLKPVELRTLDLGLLQAGAGVKGEFENRLKSVLQEVKQSPRPIILFVDEAHTLIGAGGSAGQGDAANLLKPALARGELRTIAATTFDEYKKYFEGDPALKRRFQEVRIDEPDEPRAVRMLRGVAEIMEKHHQVRILDEALAEAVRLGVRYLPERQLPDKAVSVLDTACAKVKLSQSATPPALEDTIREIEHITLETHIIERESAIGGEHATRLADLKARKTAAESRRDELAARLEKERGLVERIRAAQAKLEEAAGKGDDTAAGRAELGQLTKELAASQGESPLVYPVVDGGAVSEVVAGWTGIPIGKMVRNEIDTVLTLKDRLAERVVGQDHALDAIAQRIRTARADLGDPRRPVGVFLLVGPSGVGKTESALALADLLYGGDRNMITINMSEFKEEYKVSQLIGSPRGYEGSSEGGVLTEAVRRRPYSIVLLDEVEKSHPSVQEIFYQVFDKGMLTDSRGVEVNFKNTIILLTSNVGTDAIMKACANPDRVPSVGELGEMLRPSLLKSFKPALLGRMAVVPYFPLSETVMKQIIELQLRKIAQRMQAHHKAEFIYPKAVVDTIAARCREVESGARNVDHILTGTLLPVIARELLAHLAEGKTVRRVEVGVDAGSQFTYSVD